MLCGAALAAAFLPVMAATAAAPASIGGAGQLAGVYCTSAGNCWAVSRWM